MMYGGSEAVSCRQSVEKELAKVDKQLAEYIEYSEAVKKFMQSSIRFNLLDSREENNFMYSLYGAMTLHTIRLNAEREQLIKLFEEEEVEREKLAKELIDKYK